MRTLVLIIVMLVVVGGGFYFIALRDRPGMASGDPSTQPDRATKKPLVVPASAPVAGPNAAVVGQSTGVFLESRDPKTGRITHKFRSESLDPHRDGTVGVIKPEVRFYGKDRSSGVVVLEGSGGTVQTSSGGSPDDPHSLGTSTPTAGELQDVTVRFYDTPTDPALIADEEALLRTPPRMTVKMPAAKYDGVAGRVTTADGMVNGKMVPAERMPITVRGKDFELDGQGMSLQWNDRTGKLDSLVIERGDRLLLLNVAKFGGSSLLSYAPTLPRELPIAWTGPSAFSLSEIFDGVVAAPATASVPTTSPATRKPVDLYNATFDKDVVILRGGGQIAAADAMQVALTFGGDDDDQRPIAVPTPAQPAADEHPESRAAKERAKETAQPKSRRAEPNRAAEAPHPAEPIVTKPTPLPTSPAASQPSTMPADPVEVHWSGRLTVRPAAAVPNPPTGQMVELIGSPAWVKQNGAEARGAVIRVEPKTGKLRISPSAAVPTIEVHDADGGELRSTSLLDVDRAAGVIDVLGPGSMNVPPGATPMTGADTTTKPATRRSSATIPATTQPTTVNWTRRMHVDLADIDRPAGTAVVDGTPSQYLRQITIEGDADVKSPEMTAQAQTLILAFAAPAANAPAPKQPAAGSTGGFAMPSTDFSRLRLVQAQGGAHFVSFDAKSRQQSLAADRVRIDLKPGAEGPAVTALSGNGNVALRNADGSTLDCGTLDAQFDPTPVSQAQSSATSQNDSLARVRRMVATANVRLTQADGSRATADRVELGEGKNRRFKLTGLPAEVATNRGVLRGATVELEPVSGSVDVPGPGDFVNAGDPDKGGNGSTAMSWTGSMSADGTQGVATLNEGVHVDGIDNHGTHLVTNAGSAVVRFETKADTATDRMGTAGAATQPSADATVSHVSLDSMKSLQLIDVDTIHMLTADGRRDTTVETRSLDIDLIAGTVTAPQAGRMMLIERSITPVTQPTTMSSSQPSSQPSSQSDSQPSSQPATTMAAADPASTRPADENDSTGGHGGFGPGTLAISWQNVMNWRLRDGTLDMDGGVRLGFEKERDKEGPTRLSAERMHCTLAPIEPKPAKPTTTQPTNGVDQMAQRIDLKTLEASGNVSVRSRLTSLNAGTLSYDLATDEATASSDQQTSLEVFDASGQSHVGFTSFKWNVNTGIGTFNDVGARVRRK